VSSYFLRERERERERDRRPPLERDLDREENEEDDEYEEDEDREYERPRPRDRDLDLDLRFAWPCLRALVSTFTCTCAHCSRSQYRALAGLPGGSIEHRRERAARWNRRRGFRMGMRN